MFKSRLQELCQRQNWGLPEYNVLREGPDHMPRFTAGVNVHGQFFQTPVRCKSIKEAQNTAARIAFEHLAPPPPPLEAHPRPEISPAAAYTKYQLPGTLNAASFGQFGQLPPLPPLPSRSIPPPDTLQMYKNLLQQFAQKKKLALPVYTTEVEGPPHAFRFNSGVYVGGKSYKTMEYFTTQKAAEQAAAKAACQELCVDVAEEDGGLYKNLLQELAQKRGLLLPVYETVQMSLPPLLLFASKVHVGNRTFHGADAKVKKQAENNAAKVAYSALAESDIATEYSKVLSINVCADAESSSPNIEAGINTENHRKIAEEAHPPEKRAKYTHPNAELPQVKGDIYAPESTNVNDGTCVPCPSEGNSQIDDSTLTPKPICEKPIEEQPGLHSQTVVYPCNLNLPEPKSAKLVPGPSQGNSLSNDSTLNPEPVCEQPVEARSDLHLTTMVYPCELNPSKPESASVLPSCDEEGVAPEVK